MDSSQEYSDDNRSYNDDTVYYVELILDKKFEKGKKFYLVKWQNYPKESATWEPEENLINLTEMIDRFERNLRKQKKKHTRDSEAYFDDRDQIISRKKQKESDGTAKITAHKRQEEPREGKKDNTANNRSLPMIGHLRYRDKPQEIISIRTMNDPDLILFRVRWQKRPNGVVPTESYISNKDFMQFAPRFLLAFYQSKIKLRNFDSDKQMDVEAENRIGQAEHSAEENSLLGNIEKEKNLPKSSLRSKRGFDYPLSEIQMNQEQEEDDAHQRSVRKAIIDKYSAARESGKASAASLKITDKDNASTQKNSAEQNEQNVQEQKENHEPEENPSVIEESEHIQSDRIQEEVFIHEDEGQAAQKDPLEEKAAGNKDSVEEKATGGKDSVEEIIEEPVQNQENSSIQSPRALGSDNEDHELVEELQGDSEKKAQEREASEILADEEADRLEDMAEQIPKLTKSPGEEVNESGEEESFF